MINIRNNIFETNSSSTHCISISHNSDGILDTITPDENGIITLSGKYYSGSNGSDPVFKANYAADILRSYYFPEGPEEELLIKVIKEHTGAKVLFIKDYISCNNDFDYNTLESAFKDEQELKSFLFNPNSTVDVYDRDWYYSMKHGF